jgi:hypothetical protein
MALDQVADLSDWANQEPSLVNTSRSNQEGWSCEGKKVLKVISSGEGATVIAGRHGSVRSTETDRDGVFRISDTEPRTPNRQAMIERFVTDDVERVRSSRGDSAVEALFQENLMMGPLREELELNPVDREYPVWRGLKGAERGTGPTKRRGSIDFLGLDQEGRLHIVETKVSHSDVAILMQCLDYFLWVSALGAELIGAEEEEWRHGDGSKAVVIDIICAPKPGVGNVIPTGATSTSDPLS